MSFEELDLDLDALESNFKNDNIKQLIQNVSSENQQLQKTSLNSLFNYATCRNLHKELVESGVIDKVSKLVNDIRISNPMPENEIHYLSFGILAKISEPETYTPDLVAGGVIGPLVKYILDAGKNSIRSFAIICLHHISESVFIREEITKYIDKNIPERKQEFINSISKDPSSANEYDMWSEFLKNTDLVLDQYKVGKAWYNPADFPVCKLLEANYEEIKKEALSVQKETLIAWPEKFLYTHGWNVLGMYAFCNRLEGPCKLCPKTSSILEQIPGLQTALFSCLNPRSHIKPHIGYYQYSEKILRVHMGIVVPEGCILRVNGEERTWEEGKCLVFDDTFRHEAWNPSYDTTRIVLMLDIEFQGNVQDRNPEFYEKSKKQLEQYGSEALISGDLLQAISQFVGEPTNCVERPIKYA